MFALHWLDIVLLAGYFIAMFGVGLYSARRVRNMDDYYMGGRRFGKLMMIMYAFGAGTHADFAVGVASQSYKLGMAGIWYQWLQIFNTPFYWLLSPVFRRARCLTTADFYEMRYGPSLGILYGFMGVAINMGFLGVTLLGCAKLIEALTGGSIPLGWSMLLMTVAFVFYSLIGGLIATVWNEFVQGMLTIVMSFLLIPFVWTAVGGVAGVQARLPDADRLFRLTAPGEIGLYWIIAAAVNQMYEFVAGGTPAVYASTASHKLAWGCAWLYRETGKPEHLESACRLCDYLAGIQEADGSFVHWAFVKSANDWPYSPRLNITGQFALWIARTLHVL